MTGLQQRALGEAIIALQCAMQGEPIRALLAACRGEATDDDIRMLVAIPAVAAWIDDLSRYDGDS